MPDKGRGARFIGMTGLAAVLSAAAFLIPFGGSAVAAPSVTLSPATPGPYTNGQTVTVSGTGFPTRTADPTGLSIIECMDAGGSSANLPTDDTTCDASTVNPLPVLTDSSGKFSTSYTIQSLSTSGGSAIDCNATNDCVLWVGEDYVNNFNSNDAFSGPFTVTSPIASTPESPAAIALPVGAALLIGGAVIVARRRRSTSTS